MTKFRDMAMFSSGDNIGFENQTTSNIVASTAHIRDDFNTGPPPPTF
jgi:hypothetical protein